MAIFPPKNAWHRSRSYRNVAVNPWCVVQNMNDRHFNNFCEILSKRRPNFDRPSYRVRQTPNHFETLNRRRQRRFFIIERFEAVCAFRNVARACAVQNDIFQFNDGGYGYQPIDSFLNKVISRNYLSERKHIKLWFDENYASLTHIDNSNKGKDCRSVPLHMGQPNSAALVHVR